MKQLDLLIIGSGPAGVQAAYRAAQEGAAVGIVERNTALGGVCIHTGTIPSKTLRQAVLDLSGYASKGLYGEANIKPLRIDMKRLQLRCSQVIQREVTFQDELLSERGVETFAGEARFLDANTVRVTDHLDQATDIRAGKILIAVGTEPGHPPEIPFDGVTVLDSDQILKLSRTPESLIVVGGGVIGSEYACMFSLLETKVTLINKGTRILPFVDADMTDELVTHMTERGVDVRCSAGLEGIRLREEGGVEVDVEGGDTLRAQALLFCGGRKGAVDSLDLTAADLSTDDRGRIKVDDDFRTEVPTIFAAGDVIGFPSLASSSREQGRIAAGRALGFPVRPSSSVLPFAVYTIPEIAMVGPTEDQARQWGLDVEVGYARYGNTAKGQILGDTRGLLKLIADRSNRRLVSVHIIGTISSELIHQGQMALAFNAPFDYFFQAVLNYPTLSRAYKVAAYELMDKIGR